ncbi:MAG: isoprenyl transferase [Candidatus Omnitrophota bacterium]
MLDKNNIPAHIAIIMDGNGRWAHKRHLTRLKGHEAGVATVKKIVREAGDLGVKILTLYTFSQENWKRSRNEVFGLMSILKIYLKKDINLLRENKVKLNVIGDLNGFPKPIQQVLKWAIDETRQGTGLLLNLALNYGARLEIVHAIKKIAKKVRNNEMRLSEINEQVISDNLYTAGLPDPDLLIRTSGELRLSNFLLWQCSYTEFYFSKRLWPEFTTDDFHDAIFSYQNRHRRYGGRE